MNHSPLSKLLANRYVLLISCVLIILFVARPSAAPPQEKVNPTAAQVKGFLDRVNAYVALKKKLEAGLPPLTPNDRTTAAERHQAALAQRIREARRGARQGDLFGDAAQLFKGIIAQDSRARTRQDKGALLEEVPAGPPTTVNTVYPETAALATVPPLILTNLPPLPDSLEYRFMGRNLILRDRASNLVVDFIPGAVPTVR